MSQNNSNIPPELTDCVVNFINDNEKLPKEKDDVCKIGTEIFGAQNIKEFIEKNKNNKMTPDDIINFVRPFVAQATPEQKKILKDSASKIMDEINNVLIQKLLEKTANDSILSNNSENETIDEYFN